jgi:hypothetical protein
MEIKGSGKKTSPSEQSDSLLRFTMLFALPNPLPHFVVVRV